MISKDVEESSDLLVESMAISLQSYCTCLSINDTNITII